jgi:hypothetical protein
MAMMERTQEGETPSNSSTSEHRQTMHLLLLWFSPSRYSVTRERLKQLRARTILEIGTNDNGKSYWNEIHY